MSENEAIRLGEIIRDRIEKFKESSSDKTLSFDDLLEDIKKEKQNFENKSDDFKTSKDMEKHFLSSTWAQKLKDAFLIEQLGITLKTFNSVQKMTEHIKKYGEEKVNGNSYIVRIDECKYEIGIYQFDILGFIHELGHIVQNKNIRINSVLWDGAEQTDEELCIDMFARSFWMPKTIFENTVVENSNHGICNVNEVAKYFAVDYTEAFLRGKELCYW